MLWSGYATHESSSKCVSPCYVKPPQPPPAQPCGIAGHRAATTWYGEAFSFYKLCGLYEARVTIGGLTTPGRRRQHRPAVLVFAQSCLRTQRTQRSCCHEMPAYTQIPGVHTRCVRDAPALYAHAMEKHAKATDRVTRSPALRRISAVSAGDLLESPAYRGVSPGMRRKAGLPRRQCAGRVLG